MEERICKSTVPIESYRDLERQVQLCTSLEAHRDLEQRLQRDTASLQASLQAHRNLEERLQLYTTLEDHQQLQKHLDSFTPLVDSKELEARLGQAIQDLDDRVQFCAPLEAHQLLEAGLQSCTPLETHLEAYRSLDTRFQGLELRLQNMLKYDVSQVASKCDTMKEELLMKFQAACNELEHSISDRHMASAASSSKQMSDIAAVMKTDSERGLREVHERIEELRVLGSNQAKSLEETLKSQCFFQIRDRCMEERNAFRKVQEENMRLLEVEREVRLKQTAELRSDFVKAITREREERVANSSEQRSDINKTLREMQMVKSGSGSSSTNPAASGVGPTHTSYLNSLLIGSNILTQS